MDIILFNPAPRSGWQAQKRVELPLNLLSPATPLDRQGYRIKIIDEYANPGWKKELSEALKEKPVCFGVTSMTGPQILHALEGAKLVKKTYPDVPVVWGGIHASLMPAQTLANPYVDVVVQGEGEETFEKLVKALETNTPLSRVAGIWYKENGKILSTGEGPLFNLEKQAPLSYHLVDMKRYRRRLFGIDHVSFNSSRGCAFRCKFCWDPVMHRRKWRAMKPEAVLDQLKRIIRDYGLRGFLFTDDNFFGDLERGRRILEEIVRADLGISISKVQARVDTICKMDDDFLKLLVRAGVKRLAIGVESGSPRLLDLLQKDIALNDVIEANRRLIPYPIVPLFLFMMGLPTETLQDFRQSIALATQLTDENPMAVKTFNIYTPYPGTELYRTVLRMGLKEPQRLEEWASFNWRNILEETPWIDPQIRPFIETLDFSLMFLGKGHFVTPYKKTNPLVVALARLYYPLARYRVKHLEARFPVESRLAKALGLFARQD